MLFLAVVLPGLLFALVGLPLLIVKDYADRLDRTSTAAGHVTATKRNNVRGPRHLCTYAYDVSGVAHVQRWEACPDGVAVGDPVEIRYEAADPGNAHAWEPNLTVRIWVALGAWLVGVLVVVRYYLRARPSRA